MEAHRIINGTKSENVKPALRENAEPMDVAANVARPRYYEARWDERRIVLKNRIRELLGVPPEEAWRRHRNPTNDAAYQVPFTFAGEIDKLTPADE